MNLKEKILLFMQESAYKPLNAEDLAMEMEIRGKELKEFCFDVHNYEKIVVVDEEDTSALFEQLMGKNVEARKDFLYEKANFMEEM